MSHPKIIQGGMGVAVSGWTLARTVSLLGQLGVVSGTALADVLARRLQLGDFGGHIRRALEHFPIPGMVERILAKYYVSGGKSTSAPFRPSAMPAVQPGKPLQELTVAASFVEVFLAKEGHSGVVGINLLEKIQLPTLMTLFGSMLAGVDYVLMGAGIPRAIPGVLDHLAKGDTVSLKLDVEGHVAGEEYTTTFSPSDFFSGQAPQLKRPLFLAIVASATLAMTLAKKSSGHVDGFIVEGETAGGHNAPPRGPLQLSEIGEPVYGPRDVPDLEKIHDLGLPFWLAGSFGQPGKITEALSLGAAGVQVGTAFAFCEESGIRSELKQQALQLSREGLAHVFTDPLASPTGFPFKVAQLKGSLSEADLYEARTRICDLGYLRHLYRREDGSLGYRCPAEPIEDFLRKGGSIEETMGRKCVCNGLASTVGIGQFRKETGLELAIMTAGNDISHIAQFLEPGKNSYSAQHVIQCLLKDVPE
jgi:NAD(P)H-dependent flavin oxidoreductase YrpB (nitropropane dioxygenase family)